MIAFAYCDMLDKLTPIYRGCAEGLVENIRDVMPKQSILHITDDDTEPFKWCNVIRVKRKVGLMSWRLCAHYCAQAMTPEILFTEPDVRFSCDVMEVFNDPFDVTMTKREFKTSLKGEVISSPYTLGVNFSRNADFWKDAAKVCLKLSEQEQTWGGDIIGVAAAVDSGKYSVKILDDSYNHVPNHAGDETAKVKHYKGNRKTWLFPLVEEAA